MQNGHRRLYVIGLAAAGVLDLADALVYLLDWDRAAAGRSGGGLDHSGVGGGATLIEILGSPSAVAAARESARTAPVERVPLAEARPTPTAGFARVTR